MLLVNEQAVPFTPKQTIENLAKQYNSTADIFILNGFPVPSCSILNDGDSVTLIQKGVVPSPDEMEALLVARHTPGIHSKIKEATIAILGLGGLGSAVAGAMTKIGIGKMLLADYDVVEPSNLNRQHYFVDQIGMMKTRALRDNHSRMNPFVSLELIEEHKDTLYIKTYKDKAGKYGRMLGSIMYKDGVRSLNEILVDEGLAVEYFGGKK